MPFFASFHRSHLVSGKKVQVMCFLLISLNTAPSKGMCLHIYMLNPQYIQQNKTRMLWLKLSQLLTQVNLLFYNDPFDSLSQLFIKNHE